MLNCGLCNSKPNKEEFKKKKGCYGPAENPVWTPKCFDCDGKGTTFYNQKKEDCNSCQGEGVLLVYACPRILSKDPFISWLLQHFIIYKESKMCIWPNGQTRFFQYEWLVQIFDLWTEQFYNYEKQKDDS